MSELIKMQFVCAHELLIVTVRKRNCGKVTFLHLSVSHSVHRGVSASVHAGIQPPPGEDTPLGTTPLGRHTPLQTATAADDTHPTGMHSCWIFLCVSVGACTQTRICIEPYEDTMPLIHNAPQYYCWLPRVNLMAGIPFWCMILVYCSRMIFNEYLQVNVRSTTGMTLTLMSWQPIVCPLWRHKCVFMFDERQTNLDFS